MPEDHKVAEAILRLLIAKRDNKRQEMETFSHPILDRTAEHAHRKFQVEVEYWQLKNTVDEILTVATALGLPWASDAAKNSPEAVAADRNPSIIPEV